MQTPLYVGYTVFFRLRVNLANTIAYTPMIPSIYAELFLLRPKVAKELLQEYILPLRFYEDVCYVCFRICCILLVIYLLRTQELQLPLSQNLFKYIFFHVHKIRKIFILYSILYMLFLLVALKLYRKEGKAI